jgi:hypothetical protein
MTAAFPLQWPEGWPRTKIPDRSLFDCTFGRSVKGIIRELGLMGVSDWNIVISTNVSLRLDGLPYAGQRDPADRGVAVYWTQKGEQKVIACDRWDRVKDNLRAIEKTIQAMRGIDRWGSTDIVDKAFSGFAALPKPGWRAVLGFSQGVDVSLEVLKLRFHALSIENHPDHGGDSARQAEINEAYKDALSEVGPEL